MAIDLATEIHLDVEKGISSDLRNKFLEANKDLLKLRLSSRFVFVVSALHV